MHLGFCMRVIESEEYQRKVDNISNLFRLTGRQRLKGDNCPVFVV
jgi:hypothetical protein